MKSGLCWSLPVIFLAVVGCSAKSQGTLDGPGDPGDARAVDTPFERDGESPVNDARGTLPDGGGQADSAPIDRGPDTSQNSACESQAITPGWVDVQASTGGMSGLMTSPILRCEHGPGRLAVWAGGTERDGVDYTMMRVEISSGFSGPGTYSSQQGQVQVAIYHDDVGGFSTAPGARCDVCVGADGKSGSLRCTGLLGWFGSEMLQLTTGSFACPSSSSGSSTVMGGTCAPVGCDGRGLTGFCAVPQPTCADHVCVGTSASSLLSGSCTRECTSAPCPSGWRCDSVTGSPSRVCVNAASCGNGMVEMGEACDQPPPADHCAAGCVGCRLSARPGWMKVDANVGTQSLRVEGLPGGDLACFRRLRANADGTLTVNIPSCNAAGDFDLHGSLPLRVGTSEFNPMTHLCVSRPTINNTTVDRLIYCAGSDSTSEAGEFGRVVVSDLLCGGKGLRGTVTARMSYKYTAKAQTNDKVRAPEHIGENLDVTATLDLVEAAAP